jgi:cytochrome c-type biogenesis protein CcmH
MKRAGPIAAVAAALLWLAVAPALAVAPRTSLSDVEDEVMCPICGTLLELSQSPQAQRERAFVARQIARGRTKAEVKDALVAQYGEEVLALPKGSGFDLSAYLVPAIAFAVAAIALAVGALRWRRAARSADSGPPAAPETRDVDAERLDADLARYDL